ncbi:MAG TPA: hypothetical protein V6D50_08525 [Chroococcales cyanobacterium]
MAHILQNLPFRPLHIDRDSTAIGDAVNLAARIEELTKSYGVLLLFPITRFCNYKMRITMPFASSTELR